MAGPKEAYTIELNPRPDGLHPAGQGKIQPLQRRQGDAGSAGLPHHQPRHPRNGILGAALPSLRVTGCREGDWIAPDEMPLLLSLPVY